MEKLDTSVTLQRIAEKMRLQAMQTKQVDYRQMMLKAALVFEEEAERLCDNCQARLPVIDAPDLH